MADFILPIRRKYLSGLLACGLVACSAPSEQPHQPLTVSTPFSVLDTKALGVETVTSFDVYAEGLLLHALFAATVANQANFVGYIQSEDGGQHWSTPVAIGSVINAPLESKTGNEIQIAATGDQLLAIWQVTGEIPGMGPLVSVYSRDAGVNWQAGSNPTASDTDQSHPDLAADKQGRFHLVWLDDRDENGYQGLRYARSDDAGQHWQLAQTLDDSSCSCCWNRLLTGEDGQLNVLYRDMEPRDMALAQSQDSGQTWQRLSSVGEFNWVFNGCPHNGGGLAHTADKHLHSVVWTGADNKVGLYYLHSTDAGKTWSAPQPIAAQTSPFHSDIAALNSQHLVVIWDALGQNGYTVMLSESFDAGQHWSEARQISTAGSSASFPRLAVTNSGVLAMWWQQAPGASKQWVSAILN